MYTGPQTTRPTDRNAAEEGLDSKPDPKRREDPKSWRKKQENQKWTKKT